MFKTKDTQTTIFQTHLYLPDKFRNILKQSWAEIFRKDMMPIIPEEEFSELYSENMGRPCVAVATLIDLSILKEMLDYSDEKHIEELYFNIMVQYALQVTHLKRKSAYALSITSENVSWIHQQSRKPFSPLSVNAYYRTPSLTE